MTSKWLSSSISGISSAIHSLTTSQNNQLELINDNIEEEQLPDEDLSFSSKSSRSRRKGGSNRSASSSRASTSMSSSDIGQSYPSTPQHPRPSPRSFAASGQSAVLSGILESHPQFSVFRKSSSIQSLDSAAESEPDKSYSNQASPSKSPTSSLKEPPQRRPQQQQPANSSALTGSALQSSPSKRRYDQVEPGENNYASEGTMLTSAALQEVADASEEWHLSSVEEMESLNFGDRSGSSLAAISPDRALLPANGFANINQSVAATSSPLASSSATATTTSPSASRTKLDSALRLVQYDSPPSRKTSSSSRSPRLPTQVQFSPLSLAPSPLLGNPLPPPPPPLALDSILLDADESPSVRASSAAAIGLGIISKENSADSPPRPLSQPSSAPGTAARARTILKLPRTPGTGQSVRFSASTRGDSSKVDVDTPPSMLTGSSARFDAPLSYEDEESFEDEGASQEASLVEHSIEEAQERDEQDLGEDEEGHVSVADSSASSDGQGRRSVAALFSQMQAVIPSPDNSVVEPKDEGPQFVFTQSSPHPSSNPSSGNPSPSPSRLPPPPSPPNKQQLFADESNLFDTSAPHFSRLHSIEDWSVAETIEETGEEEEEVKNSSVTMTMKAEASLSKLASPVRMVSRALSSSPSRRPTSSPSSNRSTSVTLNNSSVIQTPDRSSSSGSSSNSSQSSNNTSRGPSTSLYRQFLRRRAPDSKYAADELGRVIDREGEKTPSPARVKTPSPPSTRKTTRSTPQKQQPPKSPKSPYSIGTMRGRLSAGSVSDYATPSADKSPTSPGRFKRPAREMEGEEDIEAKVDEGPSRYFSPSPGTFTSPSKSPALPSRVFEPEALSKDPEVEEEQEGEEYQELDSMSEGLEVERSLLSELGCSEMSSTQADEPSNAAFDYKYAPPDSLFCIAEESEPSTTVDSIKPPIFSPSTIVPIGSNPRRNSFSPPGKDGKGMGGLTSPTSPQSTPIRQMGLAKMRAHRRTQSESCAPSPNPFAKQSGNTKDLDLVHQLVAAQGDQLANNSSQRFLLSSLITNLKDDVERRDAMLENMRKQKEESDALAQSMAQEAEKWERIARAGSDEANCAKLEAFEDLVQHLTVELEERTALDQRGQRKLEEQLHLLQIEAHKARSDVRDGEIRLRHARASQTEAESARARMEREVEELKDRLGVSVGDVQQLQRERDDLRLRLRRELEDRDEIILKLRADLATALAKGEPGNDDTRSSAEEADVDRRVEEARTAALRDVALMRAELEAQAQQAQAHVEVVTELKEQVRALREELSHVKEGERKLQASYDIARLDSRTEVNRLRTELGEAQHARKSLTEDLQDLQARFSAVQDDKLHQIEKMQVELEKHQTTWMDARAANDKLLESAAHLERDAANKANLLKSAEEDLVILRRKMDSMLDDRDRKLSEAQSDLATQIAKIHTLSDECNRLKEVVNSLRKGTNERDERILRLQKKTADLTEDNLGLNIALESKQQEAALWKRQVTSVPRLPTPSQRSRSVLGSSVASAVPPRRTAVMTPLSHTDTPIKAVRRPTSKPASGTTSSRTSEAPSKENVRPIATPSTSSRSRTPSTEQPQTATRPRRTLVAA
ncbi:hypothetical protein T439DRAFT_381024 [Meredithblackwellia eburnea MCA 4105]